ncbi:uncharacterized protein N0V89_009677 [Didymosphaeria variabile]|uniref:Uncharacterized protein n=1 Tax=Didymosphaeria variabile TaxID=1932322 RepID=A0A9W8XDT7_9PLEO|nr:uncharacterized protein N0V89_009677 [Didymosphaeria variabile]KAJ4348303.1 hypothetical protein N0V89_009677 [Didymosphaeria variabile]
MRKRARRPTNRYFGTHTAKGDEVEDEDDDEDYEDAVRDRDEDEDCIMSSDMSEDEGDYDDIKISEDDMTDAFDSYALQQELEQEWGEEGQTGMDIDDDDPLAPPKSSCGPPTPGLAFTLAHRTRSWTEEAL